MTRRRQRTIERSIAPIAGAARAELLPNHSYLYVRALPAVSCIRDLSCSSCHFVVVAQTASIVYSRAEPRYYKGETTNLRVGLPPWLRNLLHRRSTADLICIGVESKSRPNHNDS